MGARDSGVLYGVSWERTPYGVRTSAMVDGRLMSMRHVGNGEDQLSVRECVRSFVDYARRRTELDAACLD